MNTRILSSTYSYLLLLTAFFVLACRKDATVKLPTVKPKLVVSSFISPQDTVLTVTVSYSTPIYGDTQGNNGLVKDATVILSNGAASVAIPYDINMNNYQINASAFPIIAGNSYQLTVSTPNGDAVSASSTVPSSFPTDITLSLDSVDKSPYERDFLVDFSWKDIPNETSYYAPIVFYTQYSSISMYNYEYEVVSDKYHENELLRQRFRIQGNPMNGAFKMKAYIYVTDKNYYEYTKSVNNFSKTPFSQPSPIYSNMEGGLGVFAAYNQLQIK